MSRERTGITQEKSTEMQEYVHQNVYRMTNEILINFYERDLNRFIEEINLFKDENNLWKTQGSIRNSAGNLALHIIGGLNHLIGVKLAHTQYVRNRDREFSDKNVPKKDLVLGLQKLIPLIGQTLESIQLEADYPIPFDDATRSNTYVLTQLTLHLNYHLGQVNYLRRTLE